MNIYKNLYPKDVALLAYNAAQLRVLLQPETIIQKDALWIITLILIIVSIVAQLIMGIILTILAKSNSNINLSKEKRFIDNLNDFVVALTALVTSINIMLNVFLPVDISEIIKKK